MDAVGNFPSIWQQRGHSWLLEEEDRERVRQYGLAVIRERDRQEYEIAPVYFELTPQGMREADATWRSWGYGPERLWNPPDIDGVGYIKRLETLWRETIAMPGDADALLRWVRQAGRATSSICRRNNGFELPPALAKLRGSQLGISKPLATVLWNDATRVLQGLELEEGRARWFFGQGAVGVVMRWLRGGAELIRERQPELTMELQPEGWPERVAREALWDPHQMGRFLRSLVEEDLLCGVLEVGLPTLTNGNGVGADFGDLILKPWWQLFQATGASGHGHCVMARRMAWPAGKHPMVAFELTEDDLELIQGWVLQHRCRLVTGVWEFSPAWAFIPVIEQIFWLHGLLEDEEAGYAEHNGTQAGYACPAITEHICDRPDRWIANDPRVNELDWRIREVILPVVEDLAREVAELYSGHSELTEQGERWAKVFYPWAADPTGYAASEIKFEEMLPLAVEWLAGEGLRPGEGSAEVGERLAAELEYQLCLEGVGYWMASQGWVEAFGVNELLLAAAES
ncbi:hypothetical protein KBY83_12045 [Cyanobium sp. WKJ7-Wakatipu]|uniref:hypothetical protein n=1 Tax=Cyanobium sp. WKJ7-Wakatipu TaxID=2823726 RepID=UPI0020CEAF3B|nr:hypothetical protein [Cyanobium sp. WKJ7-Wakatipu]MCP9784035.1 hypothetical protein [Cyanobium sp. WKJ7-Wakatipu]